MSHLHLGPRQRVRLFFELCNYSSDINHAIQEIVDNSLSEFTDLSKQLLDPSRAAAIVTHDFICALQRNEVDAFERLSISDLTVLRKAFDVPDSLSMPIQFMVDGLEVWLEKQDFETVADLVQGCGIHRWVIDQVRAVSRQKLHDFIITIALPPPGAPIDWLLELKARREAMEVEAAIQFPALPSNLADNEAHGSMMSPPRHYPQVSSSPNNSSGSRKRMRDLEESTSPRQDVFHAEADPAVQLVRLSPQLVPRDVFLARRHPLSKGITEFTLNSHYSIRELQEFAVRHQISVHGNLKVDFARAIFEHFESVSK